MQTKNTQEIQEILEEFLRKAGFNNFSIRIENTSKETLQPVVFHINTENDSRFLIGQYGNNLKALEYIFRLVVRKAFPENTPHFLVDVNEYRSQKGKALIDMALDAAREAAKDRKAVFLRPMTAYERRIVHMTLTKEGNVVTESIGEGENRKVVVKPVNLIDSEE